MEVFDLKAGETGIIKSIDLSGSARERLTALGINVGERVEVISFSLFKSSVLIYVSYTHLTLPPT